MAAADTNEIDIGLKDLEAGAIEEDKEIFDEIAKGLEGDKSRCLPGAPECLGPSFIKINGGRADCGFNPLFYVGLFLVVGLITLIAAYSNDDDTRRV